MLSLLIILIPIVSGIISLFLKKQFIKSFALLSSFINLFITCYALYNFSPSADAQFAIDKPWFYLLGIHFHLGIDGISLIMILLSNLLMPFIILSTFKDTYSKPGLFYMLMLIMQGAMNGVFISLDLFLYYIFWELALVPAYILVLLWGTGDTKKITFKFFIYTLFGSLFMLAAILWLSIQAGSSDISFIYSVTVADKSQTIVLLAFMLAYAIKIPIFPFHTWQPDTYTNSPSPVTMLLSAIMLKMGLYSIIRWVIPVVPVAVFDYGKYIIILAATGVLYASCVAWMQKDLKRLFAYSSIAHVGLIAAGILTVTSTGLQGGILQMVAHGINVIGLFYVCQIILRATQTNSIDNLGGIRLQAPVFAGLYFVVLLASIALPLTNAFPGEFMLLSSVFNYNAWLTLLAGSGVIFGAVYMLISYQKVMLGEATNANFIFNEITSTDKWILIPLAILIFLLGIFPHYITDISQPAVDNIIRLFNAQTIETSFY